MRRKINANFSHNFFTIFSKATSLLSLDLQTIIKYAYAYKIPE